MTGLIDPSQIEFCSLCHLCPAPLDLCCFVWAAGILLVLILVVALAFRRHRGPVCPVCGRGVKKKTKLCPDCGYNFLTGEPPAYARHIMAERMGMERMESPQNGQQPLPQQNVQQQAVRTCPNCGAAIAADASFCMGCGSKLS